MGQCGEQMKTISEIRAEYQNCPEGELENWLRLYEEDERSGVRKLAESAKKRLEALRAERERLRRMQEYERRYAGQTVCGIDEAGRGPLAGPVVAAAVILPEDCRILYINDSKQLSEKRREQLYEEIMAQAVSVGVGIQSPGAIDEINILQATYEAMRQAVRQLCPEPEILLNDAVRIPGLAKEQVPIIKGDAKCLSIAAASIIAKVTRDRMMREYDKIYPEYGFAQNKGYGCAAHIEALKKFGPCPIHRNSFIGHFI